MASPMDSRLSLNLHAAAAVFLVLTIAGTLVWWSTTTQIAGAVVASGAVVVDGGSKRVQHPDGGIVTAIHVRDEDEVEAGEILVELDGTALRASREVIVSQQRDAVARLARLTAESEGRAQLGSAPDVGDDLAGPEFDLLLAVQRNLMRARAASLLGQQNRIEDKIMQLESQIEGLSAQLEGDRGQQQMLGGELRDQEELLKSGLVANNRVNDLKRERTRLSAEMKGIEASIAEARSGIEEQRSALGQLNEDATAAIYKDLQETGAEVAKLRQQRIAVEDQLSRLVVRAPQRGIVHQSIVQTVGGVVGAGETLMLIVPRPETTAVDVHISPLDIDKVYPAQPVVLRLTSLNVRSTPDLAARVRVVAPDLTTDQHSGAQFYTARIDIPQAELRKLPAGTELLPGMPAEAFIHTGDRTVLSYILKPLTDQVQRAFREE